MRVVLVDPSRAVQRAMTRLIQEGGHEVVSFAEGHKALDCIRQDENIRALITSTQPFGISGIELCSEVRKLSGTRRALHVMLMSSTDDYDLAIAALDNGADDFFHKPPIPDELRARLRLADRVTSMKQQLIRYATTDALTGLLNRRAFFEIATEISQEVDEALTAILFDVDHFKQVNDAFGHEVGDSVLSAIGADVNITNEIAGRIGGEEFCVLIRGAVADGFECANRLHQTFRARRFYLSEGEFSITCSFGIAEWEEHDTIDRLVRRADIAMYQAKRTGRDRIIASDTFALTKDHSDWQGVARSSERPSRSDEGQNFLNRHFPHRQVNGVERSTLTDVRSGCITRSRTPVV